MKTQLEEAIAIINILNIKTLESFRNIESINTGSTYKSKDEILNNACERSRKGRRITSTLIDCLQHITNGGTIQDFYDNKLKNATRTNQCEQDRLDTMEELELFTDLIVEL